MIESNAKNQVNALRKEYLESVEKAYKDSYEVANKAVTDVITPAVFKRESFMKDLQLGKTISMDPDTKMEIRRAFTPKEAAEQH